MNIIDQLKQPFSANDIGWRVQQSGKSSNGIYCMVLAYVQARAIQERLDSIFGFDGWTDEYRNGNSDNNIICRLGVKVNQEWIYKENGASETHVEPFKGGISGAFKRVAASGFGIGRYLYNLEVTFTETSLEKKRGWNQAKTKDNTKFWWKTPDLPKWALPKEEKNSSGISLKDQFEIKISEISEPDQELFRSIVDDAKSKLNDAEYKYIETLATSQYKSITNSQRG